MHFYPSQYTISLLLLFYVRLTVFRVAIFFSNDLHIIISRRVMQVCQCVRARVCPENGWVIIAYVIVAIGRLHYVYYVYAEDITRASPRPTSAEGN